MSIPQIAKKAKSASILLGAAKTDIKNAALAQIADALKSRSAEIIAANQKDLRLAEKNKLASPLLKRLKFDEGKIADVCAGLFGWRRLSPRFCFSTPRLFGQGRYSLFRF